MLTETELDEIKDYVLRKLPRLLEQDPEFVYFIEGIINEKFPRRDEFARLLDEFTSFRGEQRERFDQVDQRFEQVDQRFEQVDQQFIELRTKVREMDSRLNQNMSDLRDWVQVIAGELQMRVGRNLEDIVAGALRLGLNRPDIDAQNVRLRQKISDPEGLVFKTGAQKEVDLLAHDGELLVFEVKSAPDVEDVEYFADKVELARLQNPTKQVRGVFIAVGAAKEIRGDCARRGLQLIPEKKP